MILKILLFIFIGESLAFSSLLSRNFCKVTQKKCVGSYNFLNFYKENCKNIECSGKHKYVCGQNICASSEDECNLYLHLLKIYKYGPLIFNNEEKKLLEKFKNNLSKCTFSKYTFRENDFCLNEGNCIEKTRGSRSTRAIYSSKKVACKCKNKLSYHCGKYCSVDSMACDYLKEQNTTLSTMRSINKKCGNKNKIFLRFLPF